MAGEWIATCAALVFRFSWNAGNSFDGGAIVVGWSDRRSHPPRLRWMRRFAGAATAAVADKGIDLWG